MNEPPVSQVSVVRALCEELIRSVPRLELAMQRNFENVNMTRHSINGELQKLFVDVGTLITGLKDIGGKLTILEEVKEVSTQTKGGIKLLNLVWPVVVASCSLLAGYWLGKH